MMRKVAYCPHYSDPLVHACGLQAVGRQSGTAERTSNLHSGSSLLHMQIDICSRTASPASHHVCDMQIYQLGSLLSPPPPPSLAVSPGFFSELAAQADVPKTKGTTSNTYNLVVMGRSLKNGWLCPIFEPISKHSLGIRTKAQDCVWDGG